MAIKSVDEDGQFNTSTDDDQSQPRAGAQDGREQKRSETEAAHRHRDLRKQLVVVTSEQEEGAYAFVRLIGGRWTLKLLGELAAGGRRYQDIYAKLDGVSHKVLTDTLRSAERDGLIIRRLDSERTETTTLYELTDLGRWLSEPLAAIERWVDTNWHLVETARRNWTARTDG
jgi:DNA-binding HxlR family transcriptional regulator